MRDLTVWKNQELNKLKKDLDRLFSRVWQEFDIPLFTQTPVDVPYIDLMETEDSLIAQAEIPGVEPQDLDISITNDLLFIKGRIKQEFDSDQEDFFHRERHQGFFSRTIQLPCRVSTDDAQATFQDGLLRLVMPKCRPEQAKEIKIKVR